MKAVILTEPGKVAFGEMPKPVVEDHLLLIKVECAVINPSDCLFMGDKFFRGMIAKFPYTPGWEGAGTIVEVGKDHADKGLVGKRVGFFKCREQGLWEKGGSFAEFVLTDITGIIPLRDDVSHEQGVALFVNPLSALCLVDRAKVLGAKAVIITAAASQLGRMLVTLCHQEGIVPICHVRRQA